MKLVHWAGTTVSDNRKTIRDGAGERHNSSAYARYRGGIAATIRSQLPGVRLERPGLAVQFRLEGHHDASNCLKALLDGIQDSGLVANDRHIAPLILLPTLPHPRRVPDEAWLMFWEAGEGRR